MSNSLDSAIIYTYVEFNGDSSEPVSADAIVSDIDRQDRFWKAVSKRHRSAATLDRRDLNRRLLSLRKRGQAKGGLPRLHRSYGGRSVKKPR